MKPTTRPGPDPSPLTDRLMARIGSNGPITFAEFMETALYDPVGGFYSRPASVGEEGHFVTSPHVSAAFGVLVARQVEEFWSLLGGPDPFHVIEVAAGDGTLGRQIVEALPSPIQGVARYIGVERAAAGRAAMAGAGLESAPRLGDVSEGLQGCLVANELIDNIPFHRVRRTGAGLAELYVDVEEGRFVLVDGALSDPSLADLVPNLPPGGEWPVRPDAIRLLEDAHRVLARGYVWIVDYALGGPADQPSVHGYRRHGLEPDVLADPGSRDITAGVDFDMLGHHARRVGMRVWGPVSQRAALLALGFRGLERRAQERQRLAIARRRGIESMRIYSNRIRANLLLAEGGLGDFAVMCFGVGVDEPPLSVRGLDKG